MKKSKKQNSDRSSMNKSLKLSAAVAALGVSLGVNAGDLYAAALGVDGVSLPAIQNKIDSTQLKFESAQYKEHITLLDSTQIKLDSLQSKFETTSLKFDLTNYKENVSDFEQTYPELYIFPNGISPENPLIIPFLPNSDGALVDVRFLTFGIDSFNYDVTEGGLSITSFQRSSVPEPSTMLMLGSGIAGLIVIRKLKKGRAL